MSGGQFVCSQCGHGAERHIQGLGCSADWAYDDQGIATSARRVPLRVGTRLVHDRARMAGHLMTRYDAQWPDVHAAEDAQEFTRSITAWDRAQVAAGSFDDSARGDVPQRTMRPLGLALSRYEVDDRGCWVWTGPVTTHGYGMVWRGSARYLMAHRVAYEVHSGAIPEGLTIDHLCRNRRCINPDHLEPVPNRVNVLRGVGITAQNAAKAACAHGHLYDDSNTYWRPDGSRACRSCRRECDRRRRASRRPVS